jgi:hypothetical protein
LDLLKGGEQPAHMVENTQDDLMNDFPDKIRWENIMKFEKMNKQIQHVPFQALVEWQKSS